jgi:hypothetical protein
MSKQVSKKRNEFGSIGVLFLCTDHKQGLALRSIQLSLFLLSLIFAARWAYGN